ncbi:ABC transporter ATP-binding protein [Candidatus Woesearchaeota archaeon]|nr:ABC transporter ATP-binding protein [Candidatus Woesearchaeota archaeon]
MDAITIRNLTKKYGDGTVALQNISFSIKKGEFFALLGPNGAGKTTTINILTGLANKTSGDVLLFDQDVVRNYQQARSLVGLVPQEFNLDQFDKVYNTLFFNAGYFGIPRSQRHSKIESLLRELGLWEKRYSKVRELSGGMKRKVMIARALIHEPKILILDEPTAGVDVETRKSLWTYFRRLNQKGTTILLTTHYIEEAEELCQRIAIVHKGNIIALDTKNNLLELLERETIKVVLSEPLSVLPPSLKKYGAAVQHNALLLTINPKQNNFSKLLDDLRKTKLSIRKIETERTTLEDVFLHLTKK